MTTISVQPSQLDLRLYSGDGFSLQLNFVDKATGNPWPVTGTWQGQIRSTWYGDVLTEFTIDSTDAVTGKLMLSLSGEQTRLITSAVWDLQQNPGSAEPRTWYRGTITATSDVTRQ